MDPNIATPIAKAGTQIIQIYLTTMDYRGNNWGDKISNHLETTESMKSYPISYQW